GERLLALLGVELVLLLHRHPGELATPALDLLVSLRVLGLELGELVACGLPFLASSDLVFRHLVSSRRAGSPDQTRGGLETHRSCVDPLLRGRSRVARLSQRASASPARISCS